MLSFTTEQTEIIYSDLTEIYVDAKAGTGKTTTLVEFTKIRRFERFLYLVYSADMRKEAKSKFPPNVEVHSIHSLAYSVVGIKMKDRLIFNLKVENVFDSLDFFSDKNISNIEDYTMAYQVLETIKAFCNSSNKEVTHFNKEIEDLAKGYWDKLSNMESKTIVSHDVYLKIYQLSEPILDYDYIAVDESQDLNSVSEYIVRKQSCNKIFIGDYDQKIFGFRGAISIFENVPKNTPVFDLTSSFRYGHKIAEVANKILETFKDGNRAKIVGLGGLEDSINEFDYSEHYTVISRTNAMLIDKAIESVNNGFKVHIKSDFNEIKYQALDIYYLFKNNKDMIKSDFLKKMKNFNHLVVLAEQTESKEYSLMISLIEKYGDLLYENIIKIEKNIVSEKLADITYVTAHKSKGLEFYNVVISEDFASLYNGDNIDKVDEEEINLIYVAVTRAMEALVLNKDLTKLMGLA